MSRSRRSRPAYLRLVTPPDAVVWPPLPAVVPLLHPDDPISPAEEALLTTLAHRARQGDTAANALLWRAFEARLEPVVRGGGRVTWQDDWPRRDGRPWALEDVRQEAWLIFHDLTASWNGEGPYTRYITAHFTWRLRTGVRRLGPQRIRAAQVTAPAPTPPPPPGHGLTGAEEAALLDAIAARLSPADAIVLDMRVREGMGPVEIAQLLGVNRRTITRRWRRIRAAAHAVLCPPDADA
ncbi:MAG: ECF-type sigma factor [Thermomicrobiales bacterium]